MDNADVENLDRGIHYASRFPGNGQDHTPVIDMPVVEFFDDESGSIAYPLVFHKSYRGTLLPIPFEKHCRVQLINDEHGGLNWKDEAWSNYWQIHY